MKQAKKSQAFTLMELVLIISLIGILAMVAAPRLENIQSDTLFFSEEVYTTLRYARKVAMNSQCAVAVFFSSTSIALNREKDCDGTGGFTEAVFEPLSHADQYELSIPQNVTIVRTPEENFYFDSIGKIHRVNGNAIIDLRLEVNGAVITLMGQTGVITQ